MASYNPYGQDMDHSRRILRGEDVDEWDPRYFDSQGNFRDPSAVAVQTQTHQTYSPHATAHPNQLIPRGHPDSGYVVESGHRDYLVTTERDVVHRSRSSEPGHSHHDYEYRYTQGSHRDPPRHDPGYDQRMRRSDRYYQDDARSEVRSEVRTEVRSQHRHQQFSSGLSKQEKIMAAVAGAALLAGGKELYDRHEAKEEGTDVRRNPLASVAMASLGALAVYKGAEYYSKAQAKKDRKANYILQRSRDGQMSEYYSDDDEEYSTKDKKGHKNFLESALAATGLGAAVKSLTGLSDDRRSDTRSRGGSPTPSRASSGNGGGGGHSTIHKAAIASLLAGATEAFRVSKEPGGWKGEKTKRILTAAAGAASVDAAHGADHGKLGLAESVIAGLVGNRVLNGSRNNIEEDKYTGKSRSRSRARSRAGGTGPTSSLAALATAGLGALGGKKAYDRSRSRSRGRGDYDSRDPSRDRRYERSRSRSRSIVDATRAGLAKLGLGGGASAADEPRRRERDVSYDRSSRRQYTPRESYESIKDERRSHHGSDRGHGHRDGSRDRSRDRRERRGQRSGFESGSDLGDSDDDRRSKTSRDYRRH